MNLGTGPAGLLAVSWLTCKLEKCSLIPFCCNFIHIICGEGGEQNESVVRNRERLHSVIGRCVDGRLDAQDSISISMAFVSCNAPGD